MSYYLKTSLSLQELTYKLVTHFSISLMYTNDEQINQIAYITQESISTFDFDSICHNIIAIKFNGHLFVYDDISKSFTFSLKAKHLQKLPSPLFVDLCLVLDSPLVVLDELHELEEYIKEKGIAAAFKEKFILNKT